MSVLKIPPAPNSIQKGTPLKVVLGENAVYQLAENLHYVYTAFNKELFIKQCMRGLEPMSLTERSEHLSECMRNCLPQDYDKAINIILDSLTPELEQTENNGLAPLFYMPHCNYIASYGWDAKYNNNQDPFDLSMQAQYELTKRFTCEFSIRSFLVADESRCLKQLFLWMKDPNPHVRRLCSEGTRPRLPWAKKLDSFVKDPSPCIPILEQLKNDPNLYVRRSVANHIGDIAKDHIDIALELCESWLENASKELKWVIRHSLRNPVKKGNQRALEIRKKAR